MASHHGSPNIFYGPVINPVSLTCFNTLPHCLLSIDLSGKIEWMIDNVDKHQLQKTLASKALSDTNIVHLKDGEFLIPGFIDTHTVYELFFLIARDLAWLSCGIARASISDHGNVSQFLPLPLFFKTFHEYSEAISISYLTGWMCSFFRRRVSSMTAMSSLYRRRTSLSLDVS